MAVDNATMLRIVSEDRFLASEHLFAHRHSDVSAPMHRDMMDLWRCADEFVLIEAFRESAKSTKAEEFLCLEGCFGNFNYCVLFGETYDKACQRLEAITKEAQGNADLSRLFGGPVLSRKPNEDKLWFSSGAFIQALGWEQEITGMKFGTHRPDLAYLDDIENLERVRDAGAVAATIRKLYRELRPAMDKQRRRIRITQTPRAQHCMVTELRENPDWLCRRYPICDGPIDDPGTKSLWEKRYPMEWVRKERDQFARAGELTSFMQEYMLEVSSADQKPFTEDMIRSVDMAPAAWLPKVAIFDPARTAAVKSSDRTGKVVVSRLGSKIIVHESSGNFWKPDAIVKDIFDTNEKHTPASIGVEKNSLDEFIMQPIRNEALRRGVSLPIVALQAPQDKDKKAFIMGLHPFMTAGDVVFVGGKGCHTQLVAELMNFPAGLDDIANSLAYALKMFAGQVIYEDFGGDNIAEAPQPTPRDTVFMAWNASTADVTCAAVMIVGRHISILRDWAVPTPIPDACRTIMSNVSANLRGATLEHYVPADLHDQWQRLPLVPALKTLGIRAAIADHVAVSRGTLAEAIRMDIRHRRCLSVDKRARHAINALAGGYKRAALPGGRVASEPEMGVSRLIAEGIECLTNLLSKRQDAGPGVSGHYAYNPQGAKYLTALPPKK